MVKNLPASAGYVGSILGSGRSPGEGNDSPLQYSCLGNPMNRGAWWAIICGVTEGSDMIIYMFQCHCPISSHPCPLPQSPKHCSVHLCQGSVLRWQRNRTGRPLSPPQIHRKSIWAEQIPQKNFWMLVEDISSVQFSRSVMSDSLIPSSSVKGFPWWTSPLQGKDSSNLQIPQQQSHVTPLLKLMTPNSLKMDWCNYGHNVTFHFD